MLAEQSFDQGRVADIADDQLGIGRALQRRAVAGIGQRVEHDNPVVGVMRIPVVDEVAADKAGPAGKEQTSQAALPLAA